MPGTTLVGTIPGSGIDNSLTNTTTGDPISPGTGGSGGTSQGPFSQTPTQNCGSTSLGVNNWVHWPLIGGYAAGEKQWEAAKSFVPTGWKKISCEGLATNTTKCVCSEGGESSAEGEAGEGGDSEPIVEREVIVFLWRRMMGTINLTDPSGAIIGGVKMYSSSFHMVGRSACIPSTWESKKDKGVVYKEITDPQANLEKAYPHLKGPPKDHEIVKLCFCVRDSQFR